MPKCRNCGSELQGPYCHTCGQPAATERYTLRTATIDSIAAALRLHGALPCTLLTLVSTPWVVIGDMVACRRTRYVGPVRLMVILAFFIVLLAAVLGVDLTGDFSFDITVSDGSASLPMDMVKTVVNFIAGSLVIQQFLLAVPLALAGWAVYSIPSHGRYNLAEYFVAVAYFCSLSLLLELLAMPFPDWMNLRTFAIIALVALAFIASMRAFHFGFWRALKWFVLFLLAFVAEVMVLLFLLGAVFAFACL